MNNEAYRCLDEKEIIKKHHYCWNDNYKLDLLGENYSNLGLQVGDKYIFEKVNLKDFCVLNDEEIVTKQHWSSCKEYGYIILCRVYDYEINKTARYFREDRSKIFECYNLYSKNGILGKFNFLKEIEL
jgi:hypothetical protein